MLCYVNVSLVKSQMFSDDNRCLFCPSVLFRDDFNIKVLQAFVELHEFADLNLVQALR